MWTGNHPYFPPDIVLSGGVFVENDWDVFTLIAIFGAGWVAIMAVTLLLVQRVNPKLSSSDKGLVLWFTLCGCIHVFFEGYFIYNHYRIAAMTDFFGQLWKEYALSDSRYMTSDPFVLCMESWTALIWGPLSLLTAHHITTSSPYRHPLQALVSTGHFYGALLYYCTSLYEDFFRGERYYRPEGYYFWFYFVGMNGAWIVVPLACLVGSMRAARRAFEVQGAVGRGLEGVKMKKKV